MEVPIRIIYFLRQRTTYNTPMTPSVFHAGRYIPIQNDSTELHNSIRAMHGLGFNVWEMYHFLWRTVMDYLVWDEKTRLKNRPTPPGRPMIEI